MRALLLFLLVAILFPLMGGAASAQDRIPDETPAGNLDRLRQCARDLCDSLLDHARPGAPLCVEVARHPAAWVIEEALAQGAERRGVTVTACDSGAGDRVTLALTGIGVEYLPIDADDSLARDTRIDASAITYPGRGSAGSNTNVTHYLIVRRDTIGADQTSSLETSGYDFARAAVPTRQSSGIWQKLVEPAVVLGASVVMVILLFTVRSQ